MSKSSKSSRHNDDKNYQRKVTNIPLKLPIEKDIKQLQGSRAVYPTAGTTKQSNVPTGKKFKSKLRSPAKSKTLQVPSGTTTQVNHLQATTSSKSIDKRLSLTPIYNPKNCSTMKVHQGNSEQMMIHQTKASRKEMKQNKATEPDDNIEKDKEIKMESVVESVTLTTSSNGNKAPEIEAIPLETVDIPLVIVDKPIIECVLVENITQDTNIDTNNKTEPNNTNGHNDDKLMEENKVDELPEILEFHEIVNLIDNEKVNQEHEENHDEIIEKQVTVTIIENKDEISKLNNDENASGSNLVGSTTSESSPIKDSGNQPCILNNQDNNMQAKETDDVSFISYDSNIMLKDVQIKLNDCLKENSKLLDVTDPNANMSNTLRDLSFGRTLRGISGRDSLRRMRHVTVRERLLTPNDSLFVNTSGASLLNDQSQYSELNADSPYHTINRRERKRKLTDDVNESTKKSRTNESYGLLNTSIEYIRNLRKPVQVSTPKTTQGYKFNINNKKTNDGDHTIVNEQTAETKKWCIIM